MPFRFENLTVWQRARAFAVIVYTVTEHFPKEEVFGLSSQMRRAAVSVASNIAEGSDRHSDPDFCRFLRMAYASIGEVVTQSYIAKDQGYLDETTFKKVYDAANELAAMTQGLIHSLSKDTQ